MSTHPKLPLDAEESELARAYHALPGDEPSPALDARILAQARAALGAPARRRATWFTGTGFGLAASAVMAAGIAWQMGWLGTSHDVTGVASPPSAGAPQESRARQKKADADDAAHDRVDIEYFREEPSARSNDAAPTDAVGAAAPVAKQTAPAREVASPPPPPPPAPPSPPAEPAPVPFPANRVDQPRVLEQEAKAEADVQRTDTREMESAGQVRALEESAPAAAGAGRTPALSGQALSDQALSDQAALPHWSRDAELDGDAWIERIRLRLSLGDRTGARNSLRQFALDHPQYAVPRDLQRLLVE